MLDTHNTTTHSPNAAHGGELHDKLSLDEVASRIDDLSEQLTAQYAQLYRREYDTPTNEHDADEAIAVGQEIIDEIGTYSVSKADASFVIRSRLAERLTPEVAEQVLPHIEEIVDLRQQTTELEKHYGMTARLHCQETFDRACREVDWDRMIDLLMAETWPEDAPCDRSDAIRQMQLLRYSESNSISSSIQIARDFDELINLATSTGALRKEPLPKSDSGWHIQGNLLGTLNDWLDVTKAANGYITGDRFKQNDALLKSPGWNELKDMIRRLNMDEANTTTHPMPGVIMQAMERRVRAHIQKFTDFDTQGTREEASTRPNMLHIGTRFQDELRANTGIQDVPGWLHNRLERFGHRLTHGIGFIEFTSGMDDSEHNHGAHSSTAIADTPAMATVGKRLVGQNKLRIDVRTKSADKLRQGGNREDLIHDAFREEIDEVVDHEVAHHIHCCVLTVTELSNWEEALRANPDTNINDYIQRLAREDVSPDRMRAEQFAVAFELFMNHPVDLAFRYPERFAAIHTILPRYDIDEINTLLETARAYQANGDTDSANQNAESMKSAFRAKYLEMFLH